MRSARSAQGQRSALSDCPIFTLGCSGPALAWGLGRVRPKRRAHGQAFMMHRLVALVLTVIGVGLAACGDPPKETPSPEPTLASARQAAEAQVRARLRMVGEMQMRAVQAWRQQVPNTIAVCGQINPTGEATDPFIPFVALVTLRQGKTERADLVIGMSNSEAGRVFVEMLDRCFEGGGPPSGRPQARVLPPLPLDAALAQQRGALPTTRVRSPALPGLSPISRIAGGPKTRSG